MKNVQSKTKAWLKAARLQFYPMAWIAYTLGALSGAALWGKFELAPYLAGYLFLFFLELLTVFLNEYFDYETDQLNLNGSLFSGGSRTIVDGGISFAEMRMGIFSVLLVVLFTIWLLIHFSPQASPVALSALTLSGILLGAGYTVPPFKFCYRGFGELVVGLTHGPYVLLMGFYLQCGKVCHSEPFFLSTPLFFAIMAAILLAAIPDRVADSAVFKHTFAVIFGPERTTRAAALCVVLAVLSAAAIMPLYLSAWGLVLMLVCIPHGLMLIKAILNLQRRALFDCRIDRVMQLALSYIVWFGLIPLIYFFLEFHH
jgi:1,4-dihydroxy-2-naphthoate octaprenyltransferase